MQTLSISVRLTASEYEAFKRAIAARQPAAKPAGVIRWLVLEYSKGATMKLAQLQKDGGKYKVIDPREGKGIQVFDAKDVDKAIAAHDAINSEITAAIVPAAAVRLELLSPDGQPVAGTDIPTVRAGDAVVFTQKPSPSNKLKEAKDTTEMDLAQITGYVLVGRAASGKVRAEWGQPADIGRPVPLTAAGIAALRDLFGGAK